MLFVLPLGAGRGGSSGVVLVGVLNWRIPFQNQDNTVDSVCRSQMLSVWANLMPGKGIEIALLVVRILISP